MTVVMIGRDTARLDAARDRALASVPGADLRVQQADLALLNQGRLLAARLAEQRCPDVVISNAATITAIGDRTAEDLSRLVAPNHLAPYLLLRAPPSRSAAARPGSSSRIPARSPRIPST